MVLGVSDQLLSSASNVFIVLAVARVSHVSQFGMAALFLTFLTTGLAIARGALGTPLMLASDQSDATIRDETAYALSIAGVFGVWVGAITFFVGAATGLVSIALPVAIAAPLVLCQDAHRYSALARGVPKLAVFWDGLWSAASVAILMMTSLIPQISPASVLWLWAISAGLSLLGLSGVSRIGPKLRGLGAWWRSSYGERFRYATEAGLGAGSSLAIASGSVVVIGAAAAAALRGAGTMLGPLSVLMSAVPLAVIPEAVRSKNDAAQTWHLLRRVAIGMSLLAVGVGLVGFFLSPSIGAVLLGDSWGVVAPLLPVTGLEYGGLAWLSCMFSTLRSQGRSAALLRSRIGYATSMIVLSLSAALIWGSAISMAGGLALAAVLASIAVRPALLRGSKRFS